MNKPLSSYTIKVFDKEPIFDIFGDDHLGDAVTNDDGSFRIDIPKENFKKPLEFWENDKKPKIYLKVFDPQGNIIHETPVIDASFVPFTNPNEISQCEAVVVGSGFGGTIITTSLVNKFSAEDQTLPDNDEKSNTFGERTVVGKS